MTTKQPPAQKHLEEKDSAAFEKWFVEHFANGKGTFFYSMKESFQFALEYARQEISPDINELVISNDISAPTSEGFEDAYNKFRSEHVNASFMPKDMAKAMFLAGQASRNIRQEPAVLVLPKEKEEPLEQTAENVDTFRYVRTWNRCISEVRRLNPSLKVSVGDE